MSRTTHIVVTGGEGRLASALRPYFPLADYPSHTELDVANPNSVNRYFSTRSVDVVIHCAAETLNSAPGLDYLQANIQGTANVLKATMRQQARFVYISTDYVYPGTGNHTETDGLQPFNTYAWSKLGGECAAQCYEKSLILRGSWYTGLHLRQAATDAYHSKLRVDKAAPLIAGLAVSTWTGVVNVAGPRRSWYEMAVTEFDPRVNAVARKELPSPVPVDCSLNNQKMRRLGV